MRAYHGALGWLNRRVALDAVPGYYWGRPPHLAYLAALSEAPQIFTPWRLGGLKLDAELAELLLEIQRADGSFPPSPPAESSPIATAHAVRILTRVSRPILFTKMVVNSRDAADYNAAGNLCRFIGKRFSHPVSWRRLETNVELADLNRAPLLYLAGGRPFEWPADSTEKLRTYLQSGGTVIVLPRRGDREFREMAVRFFQGLLPGLKTRPLSKDDPVLHQPLEAGEIRALTIHDDRRTLVYVLEDDLGGAWSSADWDRQPEAFAAFANFAARSLEGRWPVNVFDLAGEAPSAAPPDAPPARMSITIARLRGQGVRGGAVARLSAALRSAMSIALKEQPVETPAVGQGTPLLWATLGADAPLDAALRGNLRAFVERGGLLLVDPVSGQERTFQTLRARLEEVFGPGSLQPVPADDPLLTGNFAGGLGNDLRRLVLTPAGADRLGRREAPAALLGYRQDGRYVVLLSRYALCESIAGPASPGLVGYEADDAMRLVLNVVLYRFSGQ